MASLWSISMVRQWGIDRQHHEIPLRGLELDPGTHGGLIESYAGHHIDNRTKLTEHAQHSWEAPVFKHCQLVRRNEAHGICILDMANLYNAANQLPEDSLENQDLSNSIRSGSQYGLGYGRYRGAQQRLSQNQ